MTTPELLRAVRRQAVSVSLATGLYGVSFGALSVTSGLDVAQTMALSLLLFSGGSQFALIGVLGAGGAVGAAVASAALLGARNALYGAQLAPLLSLPASQVLPAAQLTIDESTAVATAQQDRTAARVGFWWTGAGVFVLWNLCTLAGAVAGDRMGDPRAYGLDAAAAAAFLALVWPRLGGPGGRTARLVAAAAVVVALAATPLVPAGVPVLLAAAVAILVGVLSPVLPAAGVPRGAADRPEDAPEERDDGRGAT
ncbi:AzlC family ABC transporter permease [Cellulomonas shaoxiangyii]|uniref:Branched-chain amino acid ABC transporter permease n=1 Tax=Cellulomonas shaoxiangyii TaxID=2566013 RepID=A0A4P7SM74_9CELL|nr:AzlC family ABC transporter permease [Cellulomonas shaoxiangyii]QCB93944.1 branched-chain amino acid ABC transporter permease [Cellulomonas shaoxiangyii]TGY86017.1 branched-chain amino acid ABC transporter permease [Cellulomonas shaoxiangyii]